MRVLINGLPLFAKRLADDLNEFDRENKYIFLDTYNSKIAQIKFLLLLPFSQLVISLNGVTDNSGSLNWVLRFKKKLVLQWMGTDSLMAQERFENNTILRKYIDYGHNFIDSSWLEEELHSIKLKTEWVNMKYSAKKFNVPEKYEKISAMTYIAQGRQFFYGIKQCCELAKKHPEIQFKIFGVSECEYPITENITLYGWRPEQEIFDEMEKTPIFLRLTEHEGFPLTLIEAMAHGCEVIWTFPFENATQIKGFDDLCEKFEILVDKIKARDLKPNLEIVNFVKDKFNREKILTAYVEKIKSLGK